jgi:hypothetical protein
MAPARVSALLCVRVPRCLAVGALLCVRVGRGGVARIRV